MQKFQLRELAKAFGDVPQTSERVSARLQDRVCVVTGAARGIGLAIAERFGREGGAPRLSSTSARGGSSRRSPNSRAKASMRAASRVDVGRRDDVHAMFRSIESEFGAPVAVLVNNAVWARFQPLDEIDGETVDRMFAVRRRRPDLDHCRRRLRRWSGAAAARSSI